MSLTAVQYFELSTIKEPDGIHIFLTIPNSLVPEIKLRAYFENVNVRIANDDGFKIVVQVHAKINDNAFPQEYPCRELIFINLFLNHDNTSRVRFLSVNDDRMF